MSSRYQVRTITGRHIVVGKQLGRGGEGSVYEVEGEPKTAVKLYHSHTAAERRDKIIAIAEAKWHLAAPSVAFPIDALFSLSNQFAGFTMRRVGGHKPIHSLYSPTSRKNEFPKASFLFLIRTALNIARAIASVHATGCVVGDINHSGILVSNDATVTLIDCDSFQVPSAGKTFCFFSDLVPTTAHLKPTWVAAFDLYPLQTIDTKTHWLARAEAENWICGFGHDVAQPFLAVS